MRLKSNSAAAPENDNNFSGGNMASEKIKSTKLFLHAALTIALVVLLPSPGRAQSETVKLGDLAAISNAAVYIAVEKGFFKEQGVTTDITNFASAAKQVPALVAGELEVSVGSASAGLFNAIAQQAPFRIVADRSEEHTSELQS